MKKDYLIYLLLFGIIFLKSSISYLIITSFPLIQERFQITNLQVGLIISIYYISSAIFIFIWIYVFGKYSKSSVFLISSLSWIIGSILFSFSQNFPQLIITSAFTGCGIESSSALVLVMIFKIIPKNSQGKIFSIFMAIQGLGSLFGVLVTSVFSDLLYFNWNIVFIFVAFISLSWLLITSAFLKGYNIKKIEFNNILAIIGYQLDFSNIKKGLQKKSNQSIILIALYSFPIIFFFSLWLQKYFITIHGLSQIQSSLTFIFFTGGEFLGMMLGGILYDKFYSKIHYRKIYIAVLSISISVPMFLIGFLIPWRIDSNMTDENLISISINLMYKILGNLNIFLTYLFIFIGFFSFAMIYPLLFILINDCNGETEKNMMIGLKKVIEIIGQGVSAIIGGFIADIYSIQILMLIVPICLLLILFHLFRVKERFFQDFLEQFRKQKIDYNFKI